MLLIKYHENLSLPTALSQISRAHLVPENRRLGLHTNDCYWQTSSMHKCNRSLSPGFLFDELKNHYLQTQKYGKAAATIE